MLYSSFEDMPVWQKGMELAERVFASNTSEKRGLRLDLANPAVSALTVPGNIAEGFGRRHTKDKLNFYYMSRGFIGRDKKSSDLRVQGRLFSRIGTERVARTYGKYLEELKVNQVVRLHRNLRNRLRFRLRR
jgi:23S rRNA-intervening sequence protein